MNIDAIKSRCTLVNAGFFRWATMYASRQPVRFYNFVKCTMFKHLIKFMEARWSKICLEVSFSLFFVFFLDISYHMTIKTADVQNAGTDANVYFALHGDKGETPKIALQDESQTFKRFERGRADKFVVQTADVGKVGN